MIKGHWLRCAWILHTMKSRCFSTSEPNKREMEQSIDGNTNCSTGCPFLSPYLERKINEASETATQSVGGDKEKMKKRKILRAVERLMNAGSLQRSRHCVRKSNELRQGWLLCLCTKVWARKSLSVYKNACFSREKKADFIVVKTQFSRKRIPLFCEY